MSIKFLILAAYFYPEHAASSYLNENRYEKMAEEGIKMEVYCPSPTRGIAPEIRNKYKKLKDEYRFNGLMHIHRFPLYEEGKNPVLRALRYTLQVIIQLCYGLWGKYAKNCDIIYTSSTPPIQGAVAAFVKKYRKIPMLYNLQDIFPDSLVNNGLAKKGGLLWRIGRVIENFTYRNADKIIVISEDFKKNILAKGVPEEKIEVIYNWVDQNAVVDVPREQNKLFDKYGLDRNKFYVTYNGNIGHSQNFDLLLSLAEEFKTENPDINFVIVGDGAYISELKQIVKEKILTNVHVLPFQPYEDISLVFSLGDVSLVISKPGTGNASVPSKTWSIMSASRPVLANFDENELKDILENNNCGIFTKAGDKKAFKEAIITLYKDKELCREYGSNGRDFVLKNLTKELGTQKYVNLIFDLVKKYRLRKLEG